MVVMMMALVERDGEADSGTPLGPGLLTPTSGLHKPQQVVSSPFGLHAIPHPLSPLPLQSQVRNETPRALEENSRSKSHRRHA